jgi:hypothetical protein
VSNVRGSLKFPTLIIRAHVIFDSKFYGSVCYLRAARGLALDPLPANDERDDDRLDKWSLSCVTRVTMIDSPRTNLAAVRWCFEKGRARTF